jgi:serine phosphatase RsbU (regulator of sigma subunit)
MSSRICARYAMRTPPDYPSVPGWTSPPRLPARHGRAVSGDFYLVAEGPEESTVLVVGDVIGHGLEAARRAAFVRTTFAATAPFSDDPCRLLTWAHVALTDRVGTTSEFVTAACATYLPGEQLLRWAYAGHPPAVWRDDGRPLVAPKQGTQLGIGDDRSRRLTAREGVMIYTDGLTEARRGGEMFGLDAVTAALAGLRTPSPREAIAVLRARVAEFAYGGLTDDLCLLAARIN